MGLITRTRNIRRPCSTSHLGKRALYSALDSVESEDGMTPRANEEIWEMIMDIHDSWHLVASGNNLVRSLEAMKVVSDIIFDFNFADGTVPKVWLNANNVLVFNFDHKHNLGS